VTYSSEHSKKKYLSQIGPFCDSDDEVGDCRVALAHTLANLTIFMKQANIFQVVFKICFV
jgi:hypothetical protein